MQQGVSISRIGAYRRYVNSICFTRSFFFLCIGFLFLSLVAGTVGRTAAKEWLRLQLICTDPLPASTKFDAAYILGGGQKALEYKFEKIANLYKKGLCKKVLILSRSGTTEYNKEYGRNLTNDEWSLIQLRKRNVLSKDVEMISLKDSFFGTFAEAEKVSKIVKKRDYEIILLISSPHHTQRIRESFSKFLKHGDVRIFVIGTEYQQKILELIKEYIKLYIYRLILL